ncbi:MAG: CAP domain-containing protein [Nocardioides sp.]
MVLLDRALNPFGRTLIRASVIATTLVATAVATAGAGSARAVMRPGDGETATARAATSSDSYEAKVQYLVNRKRAARGLSRLRFESCTDGTAERWAKRLATTGALYHQDAGTIMTLCHAHYAGETLGRGGFGPKGLVRTWMHSPSHRRVLLSRQAKRIGVGSYLNGRGQWVTAANFTRL